ncbi:MAG: M48 family metalloprotease [Planctomycetaceae bacterium]|nr:M48 family metalloprotease [Planctomycetaceae bacterium]
MSNADTRHRWVKVLLLLYTPFLLGVLGVTTLVAFCFAAWAWSVASSLNMGVGLVLAIPAILLVSFVIALIPACRAFFRPMISMEDELELRLPPKAMQGLLGLVREVADEQSLPLPSEVRLHAESTAHVYEEETEGVIQRILVIGGAALASLDREALSGVIAHELGHFAGGDTAFSRRVFRGLRTMLYVEFALSRHPWNPLGWLFRGYHFLFRWAWATAQREQEFAADRYQVQRIGKKQTARTLIAVSIIDEMPWSRLSSVAEWFAVMRTRNISVYGEQVRRARQVTPSQWQEACRKALKQKTESFDSHPGLRERLKAIGVSPKMALELAAGLRPAETTCSEFIQNWDEIDESMSAFLVALVQSDHEEKREMAAILLGRPV